MNPEEGRLTELRDELAEICGVQNLNPWSVEQLRVILFEGFALPSFKNNWRGEPSTATSNLLLIRERCKEGTSPARFIDKLIEFRECFWAMQEDEVSTEET